MPMPLLYEAYQPAGTKTTAQTAYTSSTQPPLVDINGLSIDVIHRERRPIQALISLSIGFSAREGADVPVIYCITVDDEIVAEAFAHHRGQAGYTVFFQKVVFLTPNREYTIKGKFAPRDAGSTAYVLQDDTVSKSTIPRNFINVLLLD